MEDYLVLAEHPTFSFSSVNEKVERWWEMIRWIRIQLGLDGLGMA